MLQLLPMSPSSQASHTLEKKVPSFVKPLQTHTCSFVGLALFLGWIGERWGDLKFHILDLIATCVPTCSRSVRTDEVDYLLGAVAFEGEWSLRWGLT